MWGLKQGEHMSSQKPVADPEGEATLQVGDEMLTYIGQSLHTIYRGVEEQELPDRIKLLIMQLEAGEESDAPRSRDESRTDGAPSNEDPE